MTRSAMSAEVDAAIDGLIDKTKLWLDAGGDARTVVEHIERRLRAARDPRLSRALRFRRPSAHHAARPETSLAELDKAPGR